MNLLGLSPPPISKAEVGIREEEGSSETKLKEAKREKESKIQRWKRCLILIFEHYADRVKEFSAVHVKTQFQYDMSSLTSMTEYTDTKNWCGANQAKESKC